MSSLHQDQNLELELIAAKYFFKTFFKSLKISLGITMNIYYLTVSHTVSQAFGSDVAG